MFKCRWIYSATFFCSDLCLSKKNNNLFFSWKQETWLKIVFLIILRHQGAACWHFQYFLSARPHGLFHSIKLTLTHCTILWYEVVLPESTPGINWTQILKWMNLQRAHLNCIKRFKLVWKTLLCCWISPAVKGSSISVVLRWETADTCAQTDTSALCRWSNDHIWMVAPPPNSTAAALQGHWRTVRRGRRRWWQLWLEEISPHRWSSPSGGPRGDGRRGHTTPSRAPSAAAAGSCPAHRCNV